ncbi:hypothetical protein RCH10_004505 [Variovorax sp. GrIS 2.14]|uniref:hypothetical protein n=1 Tax=Variovorax sp. GrIS 2.14 TaxID=3071709 RepID=UPI0038F77235
MLHPVVNDLRMPLAPEFAVVAALGGVPTSHALRLVRNVTRRKFKHSYMPRPVLLGVLAALRFDAGAGGDNSIGLMPFDWFLQHHRHLFDDAPVIVRLTSHAMVMERDWFVDHLHPVPTPIANASATWQVSEYQCLQRLGSQRGRTDVETRSSVSLVRSTRPSPDPRAERSPTLAVDIDAQGVLMDNIEVEREIFALVLLKLVREKCGDLRARSVSMNGLLAQVPANERIFVRHALTALSDHGALVMNGDQVGMTSRGHLFIIQRASDGTPVQVPDPVQNANLIRLRKAVLLDARLSSDNLKAAQSPPDA